MKKQLFIILTIATCLLSCEKQETIYVEKQEDDSAEKAIVAMNYDLWASASESHDSTTMKALVVPGSSFEGMTNSCKTSWDNGAELYYQFSNLSVVLYENSAAVSGNITMIQGEPNNFSGTFGSESVMVNGQWKLKTINANY